MDLEELVEVYSTNSELEAEVIRGRLDAEGIESQISGANQGGFVGVIEVKIFVKAADHDRARSIVEDKQTAEVSSSDLSDSNLTEDQFE